MSNGEEQRNGSARVELLLRMYDRMWDNINRHITVVWQSVGVVVAAFAVYAVVGDELISLDVASALVVLISMWLIANLYDASSWYNRNQAVIVNIERLLLYEDDLTKVHPYFAKHRDPRKMLRHLRIQMYFGYGVVTLSLLHHLWESLLPTFGVAGAFTMSKTLPYVAFLIGLATAVRGRNLAVRDMREFSESSPGPTMRRWEHTHNADEM